MSCFPFPRFVPDDSTPTSGGAIPPGAPTPRTRLIESPDEAPIFTENQTTDARTALTRGLAEYLSQLQVDWTDGRRVMFRRVFSTWADPEEIAEYPSAIVYSTEAASYDALSLRPVMLTKPQHPRPDGRPPNLIRPNRYLVKTTELALMLRLEVWATDAEERQALTAMLENALVPTLNWYGVRLALPHYFGAHATYELMSSAYVDSDADATRRNRNVALSLKGVVDVLHLRDAPLARPSARVETA